MTIPYDDIVKYCKEQSPNEACGIVIIFKGRYKWIPCENVSTNKTNEFAISPVDFAKAEDMGEIVAIVHSHPASSSAPSKADLYSHKQQSIDWLIIGLEKDTPEFSWLRYSTEKATALPLYGREYIWHITDCGSFIRDFYKQEFNVDLPDFYRPEKFWEKGLEIYLDCYEKAGFYEIPMKELRYGDVILMSLGSEITTHGAVYLEDNKIAHHLNNRLSCRDVYGKFYIDRTTKCLRYKDKLTRVAEG